MGPCQAILLLILLLILFTCFGWPFESLLKVFLIYRLLVVRNMRLCLLGTVIT